MCTRAQGDSHPPLFLCRFYFESWVPLIRVMGPPKPPPPSSSAVSISSRGFRQSQRVSNGSKEEVCGYLWRCAGRRLLISKGALTMARLPSYFRLRKPRGY